MKKLTLYTIISIITLTSCSSNSNSTDCGSFWYTEQENKSTGYQIMKHIIPIEINNHFYLCMVRNLPIDKTNYYEGTAGLKNDTLNINIEEKTKFIYQFKTTLEVSPRLKLYSIYFYCKSIPKTICINGEPIDSLEHLTLLPTKHIKL